jgi:hypothetical protein
MGGGPGGPFGAGQCSMGFACVAGTGGAADMCSACGAAIGQPCCGTGMNRSCDATLNLSCVSFNGSFVCDTTP